MVCMKTVLLMILCVASALSAAETEPPRFSDQVSVSLVNLYASVRDSKGRPVYALKQEDFVLFEDGKHQTITNFSADITEPLNIAFLLDVSGSMKYLGKLDIAKGIIRDICGRLGSEDQVALLIFADGEVELLIDFTTDKEALIRRIAKLEPYGGTALRNAIAFCHRLLIQSVGKKGVLLLSDGVDTRSDLTLQEAIQQAAAVELPIYTFELVRSKWMEEGRERNEDDVPLLAFAEGTGGLYFSMDELSSEEITKACLKIFEDLKYQYYIGYVPEGGHSVYGRLELKTRNPKHRVRVRYSVIHGG